MLGKRGREGDSASASDGGGRGEGTENVGETSSKKIKLEEDGETRPEEKQDSQPVAADLVVPPERNSVKVEMEDEREKMELLVSAFSNSQQDQYEIFRRSTFPKSTIRKLMQGLCGSSVPQNAVIAMAGIAKVYVGEIVEEACQAREAGCEEGPLQPKHIREAVRRLRKRDKVPNSRYKKVFPFR